MLLAGLLAAGSGRLGVGAGRDGSQLGARDVPRTVRPAAYPYARHSAKPLGVVGFDVWAEAAVAPDFEDEVEGTR